MEEEKQNGREYWEGIMENARLEMKRLEELSAYIGNREEYKIFLNLIGRDLMYASVNGINVSEDYKFLQSLRKRCY